jgi:hypothetical protein
VLLRMLCWQPISAFGCQRGSLRQFSLVVITPGSTAIQPVAIRHRVETAIGINRPLATRKRIEIRIRAPVVVDVTVRIRLIVALHERAVMAVIGPHMMVALRVCGDHWRQQRKCEYCFLYGEREFSQGFHI